MDQTVENTFVDQTDRNRLVRAGVGDGGGETVQGME